MSACAEPPPQPTLAIYLDLRCTTCDDFLRCRSPASEAVTIYRLREKGFWAHIATIGDYLRHPFGPRTRDERPLSVYVEDRGARVVEDGLTALVDSESHLLGLGGRRIDQRTGDWTDERGGKIGQCVAIKRRDGYALVRTFVSKGLVVDGSR